MRRILRIKYKHGHGVRRGGGGGGILPYMAYTGMCRWTGYGFLPLCPKQGIQFRVSLSTRYCLLD